MLHTQINSFFWAATKSLRHDSFTAHWWIHTSLQGFTVRTSHKWLRRTILSTQADRFASRHFVFTKDRHSYLFSLTKRKPKRISFLYKKRWKAKIGFGICFVRAITEVAAPQKWPNDLTSREPHSHLSMKHHHPEVCLGASGCVSVCSVHRLASCPKGAAAWLYATAAYEGFTETPSFWTGGSPVQVSSSICINLMQVPSRSLSHIFYL